MTQNTPTPTSPAAEQGSWYAGHTGGGHHGIVACERTGRTVALVYDPADTPLLTAAPELLDACRALIHHWQDIDTDDDDLEECVVMARDALNKVEGR